jgi:hypothetical protein
MRAKREALTMEALGTFSAMFSIRFQIYLVSRGGGAINIQSPQFLLSRERLWLDIHNGAECITYEHVLLFRASDLSTNNNIEVFC